MRDGDRGRAEGMHDEQEEDGFYITESKWAEKQKWGEKKLEPTLLVPFESWETRTHVFLIGREGQIGKKETQEWQYNGNDHYVVM